MLMWQVIDWETCLQFANLAKMFLCKTPQGDCDTSGLFYNFHWLALTCHLVHVVFAIGKNYALYTTCFIRKYAEKWHFIHLFFVPTAWLCGRSPGYIVGPGRKCCADVAWQQGGQLCVMSVGLRSCLLSVPGPDKNRQAGLGRPAWSCHHGHLLTAIITSAPASHRYSIQTQLRALHVPLQPAITNTPASLTRLPFFPLANL